MRYLGSQVACSCNTSTTVSYSQMGSPIDLELGRGSKPVLNSILPSTPSKTPDLVRICSINPREITLQINIAPIQHRTHFAKVRALLDSGVSTIYIDRAFALEIKLPLLPMANPIPVYNVDGTRNSAGDISHYAEIVIEHQGHREKVIAEITNLGKNQMILGYTWLKHHNPEIDWITGNVRMMC